MPLYCCYCGTLSLANGISCETCLRKFIQPPALHSDEETDEEQDNNNEEQENKNHQVIDLQSPPDHQDMIYGYIERFRGETLHTFHFCKEADGTFILAAAVNASREGPVFLHTRSDLNGYNVTMAEIPKCKDEVGFIACLMPTSFFGTEFLITTKEESHWTDKLLTTVINKANKAEFDRLSSITRNTTALASTDSIGKELGLLVFDANLLGTQPNSVKVSVRANPSSERANEPIKSRLSKKPTIRTSFDKTLFQRLRGKKDRLYRAIGQDEEADDEVATFETKRPQWNQSVGGWTLDFNGRVTVSSKKNVILIPSEADELLFGSDTIGLRFGKVAKHKFSLDYRFPFSPITAMSVALAMFTSKLVVAW